MNLVKPRLDPGSVGISFIDILFALAVGQVLDPVKNWGENPKTNPLPLPVWTQLAVVLVLILTSWVGYHNSVNRPRFRLGFFNWELAKFVLDVAMVVVYFLAAAIAARAVPTLRVEALMVMVAFGLYALWDAAGAIQKWGSDKPDSTNPYKLEWERIRADKNRPDVGESENWSPTNWTRIRITWVFLAITAVFVIVTLVIRPPAPSHPLAGRRSRCCRHHRPRRVSLRQRDRRLTAHDRRLFPQGRGQQ